MDKHLKSFTLKINFVGESETVKEAIISHLYNEIQKYAVSIETVRVRYYYQEDEE